MMPPYGCILSSGSGNNGIINNEKIVSMACQIQPQMGSLRGPAAAAKLPNRQSR